MGPAGSPRLGGTRVDSVSALTLAWRAAASRGRLDRVIQRLLILQIGVTAAVALVCVIYQLRFALSALCGGGIGIAATAAAALCVARTKGLSPGGLLGAQVLAELVKFGVTLGLFVVTFLEYEAVAVGPLFIAYAATLGAYGLAMLGKQ